MKKILFTMQLIKTSEEYASNLFKVKLRYYEYEEHGGGGGVCVCGRRSAAARSGAARRLRFFILPIIQGC